MRIEVLDFKITGIKIGRFIIACYHTAGNDVSIYLIPISK